MPVSKVVIQAGHVRWEAMYNEEDKKISGSSSDRNNDFGEQFKCTGRLSQNGGAGFAGEGTC